MNREVHLILMVVFAFGVCFVAFLRLSGSSVSLSFVVYSLFLFCACAACWHSRSMKTVTMCMPCINPIRYSDVWYARIMRFARRLQVLDPHFGRSTDMGTTTFVVFGSLARNYSSIFESSAAVTNQRNAAVQKS